MQLQFRKTIYPCLQQVRRQVQNQEQTQEVRLGEDMPDIGRVLGTWGQVLLRSKEWRNGGMTVSGGVMVWVMYVPEDGSPVRWVDTWIPFQMKWELPDTQYDGVIRAQSLLRSVDARSTSARRLMVRASVGTMAEAWASGEFTQYTPENVPEDVELLENTYPFQLPREAGEKSFNLEEIFTLPPSAPRLQKLVRYELTPQILDRKVMGSKLVFRGAAMLHILYLGDDGVIYSWDFELPFSQYGELEGDYDQDATAEITLAVTSLEMEPDENGNLRLNAGLTGQYVISNRNMVTVVEDAYSPKREVTLQKENMQVPVILEQTTQTVYPQLQTELQMSRVADIVFYPDHPRMERGEDGVEVSLSGQFSALYYDEEGALQAQNSHWEGSTSLSTHAEVQMDGQVSGSGKLPAEMQAELLLELTGFASQGMDGVTALELGEEQQPDPNRPSLILRKLGEDSLWELAKKTGSTVEAIRTANQLSEDWDKQKILLIPIA